LQFITVDQFYQTQIGVRYVDNHMRNDQQNVSPTKEGNIGPYNDGTLLQ